MSETTPSEKLSLEIIIDIVRSSRNDLIKDLLNGSNIQSYFLETYRKELSKIKTEFISRDLKEMLISPVDLVHYASLIREIRETNSPSLSAWNNELFYRETKAIFDKYQY